MKSKILIGLFIYLILISGISLVYAVEPHPECPKGYYEWDSERQKCITTPKPTELGEEPERFNPNIAIWFKPNVTKNQAIELIESFNLSKYTLSKPGWDDASWLRNHGGMVVISVPHGSEQEYIQRFKEDDIVKIADLNIVYEPGGQIGQKGVYSQKRGYVNTIIVVGIVIILIFVLLLIWYKFHKK